MAIGLMTGILNLLVNIIDFLCADDFFGLLVGILIVYLLFSLFASMSRLLSR